MNIVVIGVAILMSIFSTSIMSYISMATPLGPWIAPTIVLMVSIFFRMWFKTAAEQSYNVALVTICASVGGILATACGFSFPTLFFIDAPLFNSWMANPAVFIGSLMLLAGAGGCLAFVVADYLQQELLNNATIAFPISHLTYNTIALQQNIKKSWQLMFGFVTTIVMAILQSTLLVGRTIMPHVLKVVPSITMKFITIPAITLNLDIFPLLLAIGFIAGTMIAIPLAVGALSKIIIVDTLNVFVFNSLNNSDFVLAFCSGMIAIGAFLSFKDAPLLLKKTWQQIVEKKYTFSTVPHVFSSIKRSLLIMCIVVVGFFLWFFSFSFLTSAYLIVGTIICTYQLVYVAVKIGLAPLGRYATFVMVPALFIFKLNAVQIAFIATFVELCGGIATDLLFGRKVGQLAQIPPDVVRRFQLLGLIVSCITVGVVFWLLINYFGLGSQELCAQRSQSRALLINIRSFDMYVLLCGALFGIILKYCKLNPLLVLGGLLMPINYSLGLIIGGLLTYCVSKPADYEPFWSGVFAGGSIIELIKTLL